MITNAAVDMGDTNGIKNAGNISIGHINSTRDISGIRGGGNNIDNKILIQRLFSIFIILQV